MSRAVHILPYVIYLLAGIVSILLFNGTGDSGDSITHYLFARYAPFHPEYYLNHWAKPVFVLLASPWAQFGFIGIKIFNFCCMITSAFAAHKLAHHVKLPNSWLIPFLFLFAPLNYILTFSGLTEPLFSMVLSFALLCSVKNRLVSAAILVSFLPFIRSEGLLIIGVFGLLFLLKRNWKATAAMIAGSLIFELIGYAAGKPFLWTINQIPYATTTSVYGNGDLFSFPNQLVFVLGVPILILFLLGLLTTLVRFKTEPQNRSWIYLIIGCFSAVFSFHTMAWAFGSFNAMGLNRVMLAVMPAMATISLFGFNLLVSLAENPKTQLIVKSVLLFVIFAFPFTSNHASVHWEKDMVQSADQVLADEVAQLVISENASKYWYSYNQLSMSLEIDHLDKEKREELCAETLYQISPGDYVIWDNWSASYCNQVELSLLDQDKDLIKLKTFSTVSNKRKLEMVVFKHE